MSSSTPDLPVLIIGAGISGLCLAQGLRKASIPFIVFERDPALNIRSQGYRVRINDDGIAALKKTLPPPLYARLVASCAQIGPGGNPKPQNFINALTGLTAQPKSLEAQLERMPPQSRPPANDALNADRNTLRNVLISGLEEYVKFGKGFTSYEATPTGVTVRFSDESEVEGSLLVGADGAGSRVRKQMLPRHIPLDTEGRFIYGKTTLTSELVKAFSETALLRLTVVQERKSGVPRSLLLEPVHFKDNEYRAGLPEDYVYWVLMSRKDQLDIDDSAMLELSAEEVSALAQKLTAHWHPSFHALFALQNRTQTAMLRICSSTPEIPIWKTSGYVTLIGDAVHILSPTSGVGAVTALRDSATLTEALKDGGISSESLGKYETLMREYSSAAIRKSPIAGKALFGMRPLEELSRVEV